MVEDIQQDRYACPGMHIQAVSERIQAIVVLDREPGADLLWKGSIPPDEPLDALLPVPVDASNMQLHLGVRG